MNNQQQPGRDQIEDEKAVGFNLLGYTIVFSAKGLEIDNAGMEALLKPHGWDVCLPDVRIHTRLKRAIMRWMRDQISGSGATFGTEEKDERKMLREITRGSTAEIIAYAIVSEKSDLKQWGLDYLTNVRVFLNQSTGSIIVNKKDKGDGQNMTYDQILQDSFMPYWNRYKDVYITHDIGRWLPRVLETLQPTSMKDGGGTYFVPYFRRGANGKEVQNLQELQTLKDILEIHIPTAPGETRQASLTAIPVIDRAATKKNMAFLAYRSLEAEINDLEENLKRFTDEITTPVKDRKTGEVRKNKDGTIKYMKIRSQTITDRLDVYRTMRNKVTLFSEKLGVQQETLQERLARLQGVARSLQEKATDVLSQEDEASKEFPINENESEEEEATQPF